MTTKTPANKSKKLSHEPALELPSANTLGLLIRGLRKMRKLYCYKLADMIGISPSLVTAIETGRRMPKEDVIVKIAGALAKNEAHRDKLLLVLRDYWSKAVADRKKYRLKTGVSSFGIINGVTPRMPLAFINRLVADTEKGTVIPSLITVVSDIVEHNRILSAEEVMAVADLLDQPKDDYLFTAGYLPFAFKELPVDEKRNLKNFLRRLSALSPQEIDIAVTMLMGTMNVFATHIKEDIAVEAPPRKSDDA